MLDDFKALEKRVNEYFNKVSLGQLKRDLESAGYSYYKDVTIPVLDSFLVDDEILVSIGPITTMNVDMDIEDFQEFSVSDTYPIEYHLAA